MRDFELPKLWYCYDSTIRYKGLLKRLREEFGFRVDEKIFRWNFLKEFDM